MAKLLIISLISLFFTVFPLATKAEIGASLYLSPSTGTFFVGSTFDVSIFANTEGSSINAVQVDLKFPAHLLQVVSPTGGSSFVEIWVEQPSYSNQEGTIRLKGGVPAPGINTSSGLVSTVTFRAKAIGKAVISFLDSSQILLADGKGTNILKSTGIGEYALQILPPEGPKVSSLTHPSLTTWYKNNNPSFYWEKEAGVSDFSYILDNDPQGIPDNMAEGGENSITLNDVADGIWYFHIKARKGTSWGGITHYPVQIDNTAPGDFTVDIKKIGQLTGSRFFAYFSTDDLLSEIDYYEVSTINLSGSESQANPFFIESESPYKVPFESAGKYAIIVRVYDKAGNLTEAKSVLRVVSPLISYTEKGIRVGNLFLPWWLLYSILIILLSIFGFSTYYFLFKKKGLVGRLKKEVSEAEKEIEDVKKVEERIHQMRTLEEEAKRESERLAAKLKGEEKGKTAK